MAEAFATEPLGHDDKTSGVALKVDGNSRIVIRRMAEYDVPALVRLHAEVFRGYDNTMMGDGYLRSLYRILACHRACISIVAIENGTLVGWLGGVSNWLSFQRTLTLRNIHGAPAMLLSILKNRPAMLTKAFCFVRPVLSEFVRRFQRRVACSEKTCASPTAALMVIGVDPRYQQQGVGQCLMAGLRSTAFV